MNYAERMKDARDILERQMRKRRGKRPRNLTRDEVEEAITRHVGYAHDIAADSGTAITIVRMVNPECLGFVEVGHDEPTVNGLVWLPTRLGLYKPYSWGGFPHAVDYDAFDAAIRELWDSLPDSQKGRVGAPGGTTDAPHP